MKAFKLVRWTCLSETLLSFWIGLVLLLKLISFCVTLASLDRLLPPPQALSSCKDRLLLTSAVHNEPCLLGVRSGVALHSPCSNLIQFTFSYVNIHLAHPAAHRTINGTMMITPMMMICSLCTIVSFLGILWSEISVVVARVSIALDLPMSPPSSAIPMMYPPIAVSPRLHPMSTRSCFSCRSTRDSESLDVRQVLRLLRFPHFLSLSSILSRHCHRSFSMHHLHSFAH